MDVSGIEIVGGRSERGNNLSTIGLTNVVGYVLQLAYFEVLEGPSHVEKEQNDCTRNHSDGGNEHFATAPLQQYAIKVIVC